MTFVIKRSVVTSAYYKISRCGRATSTLWVTTTFDVLVVGGGIHGLATALDAAARGLTVALVEAGDFAAATSFNHQRTAHGGLRSLQSGRLGHARESIRERRALARIAPRLLRPLPFIIGTYRSLDQEPAGAARRVPDRSLAGPAPQRRPRAGAAPAAGHADLARRDAEAVSRRAPGRPDRRRQLVRLPDRPHQPAGDRVRGRRGRARRAARELRRGGRRALKDGERVAGMRVRDVLTGAEIDVRARLTINAAGAARRRRHEDVRRHAATSRSLKAMNLVTSKPASDIALAAPGRRSGPDADARALAGTRADRHRAVRRLQAARRPRRHGRRNRRLHRRRERRLPRARS